MSLAYDWAITSDNDELGLKFLQISYHDRKLTIKRFSDSDK
jgi:hypothetical protein